jgi:hypothetical protein
VPAYKPLPTIDPPDSWESLQAYGCRVMRFVIETDVTATLSDRDLELADHFYPLAQAAPDLSEQTRETLSRARHVILAALRGRAPVVPVSLPSCIPDDRPTIGPMAPLSEVPIIRPPANSRMRF